MHATLGPVLEAALTKPETLGRGAARAVTRGLRPEGGDRELSLLALDTLAAILYTRPDLAGPSLVGSVVDLATGRGRSDLRARALATLELVATSGCAPQAARGLMGALARAGMSSPEVRGRLVRALAFYARWRPELLDLARVVQGGRAITRARHRDVFLGEVVEPLIFAAPRALTPALARQLAREFRDRPRIRYTLAHAGARHRLPRATGAMLRRMLARSFPRRRAVSRALGQAPRDVVVVHNIDDGQGDELVRVVPLVQALLGTSGALRVVVLTRRAYLYDHPRLAAASIFDDGAVDRALRWSFDGVVLFHEPTVPEVNYRPALAPRFRAYIAARRPRLVIRAGKGSNHFTFQDVRVDGRPLAQARGLDRRDVENVYDPVERLALELGLPMSAGEPAVAGNSALVGAASAEADAAWRRLADRDGRPVALVNAFGGRDALKGFTAASSARLAAELGGLVDEGLAVLLLPNGQPWGSRAVTATTLARLDRDRRARVTVAPDPAESAAGREGGLSDRPDLSRADRVMRLFKYLASRADLIVTVEGWLMHLAHALGRPVRLFLAPRSHAFEWHPRSAGSRQRLVPALSTLAPPDAGDLLRPRDPPPMPAYPRKLMLLAALAGLGRLGGLRAGRLVRRALASPDPDLRAAALAALGGARPVSGVRRLVTRALHDPAAPVRAAAAGMLLAPTMPGPGCSPRARLVAHREIARQNWRTVTALGPAALPALEIALRDRDAVIQREARWAMYRMLERHVRPPGRGGLA